MAVRAEEEPRTEPARVRTVIGVLTGAVFLMIWASLYALPHQSHAGPSFLASLSAGLNAGSAACLLAGYGFIRARHRNWHQRCMLAAFGLSSAFLITYLVHHAQVGSVPYQGVGALRFVYYGLLVPHILLAAAIVPLALLTIYRGWTVRLELHRRIARVTLPLWLYVSLSGVLLYFMLYQ